MKKKKTNANFWRMWWDSQASVMLPDYFVDRLTSYRTNEMEKIAEDELLDFVNPKSSDFVFDAGCGTGIDLTRLSSKVNTIIGMDQSEGMTVRCKERIKKENITNACLIVGNITDLGIKSNVFDKIICMSVLHYLNDEECEAALNELFRIAKDGAIIVFHVKNLYSLYLLTLYFAKKIKYLFTTKINLEYYRPHRWYERKLSKLGAQILDFNSSNIFLLDFLPKFLYCKLQNMEFKYYKGKFFRKYGADYKIKAKIKKTQ